MENVARAETATPYANTTNQESTGFQDGTIDPFTSCTVEAPNYGIADTNNGTPCLHFYWQANGYDGTRDDRGTEACSDLQSFKEGWYGFYIYLPAFNSSFVNSYPTNKQAGCAQIFQNGYCGGSWAALMIVTNNSLYLNYRSYCGTPNLVEIGGVIPRNAWVPVIIHFIASHTNGGMMQVWFDGAPLGSPSYGVTNINFGFGTWNDDDSLVSTNPLTYKFGQYDYDDGNYTTNETRTSYYNNVCQLVDPLPANGWAVVNPGVGSPPDLTANNGGSGEILLNWTAVPGATSYNIYRSPTNGTVYGFCANVAVTNFLNTGLTNGKAYYYFVTATNVNGESPPSPSVVATPNVGSANLIWSGGVSGDWDINSTANWRSNTSAFVYLDGDLVWFDDSSSVTNVTLVNTVRPGGVMVSNNTSSYILFSTGGNLITGVTGLTKDGSGSLFFSDETNSFGGSLVVNAGTLDLGTLNQSAATVTLAGGTIQNGILTAGSYLLQSGFISAGLSGNGAQVAKTTTGTVTLSGSNTFIGTTTVNAGILELAGDNSSASTSISVANGAVLQLAGAKAAAASSLLLNSGATMQLRGDRNTVFSSGNVTPGATVDFDVNEASGAGTTGTLLTLTGPISFAGSGTTLNVTGGNGYSLGVGAVSGGQGGSVTLNPTTANLTMSSFTALGNSSSLVFSGSGNTTVTGGITNNSTKSLGLVFNQTGVVTLSGTESLTGGVNAPNSVISLNRGTLVLNNSGAISAASARVTLGLITGNGSNSGATLLLGGTDTAGVLGGIDFGKNIVVEDGGATPNNGALILGGQNTNGVNLFSGVITLGASTNTGKSLTLLAATRGEVDFTGGIMANGTDDTAGVTLGDAAHAGIIRFAGTNTYAGPTTVSNGTLFIATTQPGWGGFVVQDGSTLGVIGSGNGSTVLMSSLTLGNAGGPTTLLFSNVVGTAIPLLTVTNRLAVILTNTIQIAATNGLRAGGVYPLVKFGSLAGAGFSSIGLGLPPGMAAVLTNDTGDSWIALKVINPSVNTSPPALTVALADGQCQLSWPLDHIGWELQMQTNALSVGLGSNWMTLPGSKETNEMTVPAMASQWDVFYRLVYP
jgi:autotransporter-associated beta strand protein